jgi:hypothetical protein
MRFRTVHAAVMAGALFSCVGLNVASAQAPAEPWVSPGTTYSAHTNASGGCPAMDWHIVRGNNGTLSGVVGVDDMKTMFKVTGSFSGANFHMDGTEIGGTRTGAVNGQIQSEGRVTMTLGGLPVGSACQGKVVYIPFSRPAPYSGGNG